MYNQQDVVVGCFWCLGLLSKRFGTLSISGGWREGPGVFKKLSLSAFGGGEIIGIHPIRRGGSKGPCITKKLSA